MNHARVALGISDALNVTEAGRRRMCSLEQQERIMKDEQETMEVMLVKAYPVGAPVSALLSATQINPTWGKVINHNKSYLRVRFDTEKCLVRDVHFSNIIR